MKANKFRFYFCLLLASSAIHAQAESDLAQVGIAEFRNLDRNPDYDRVAKSLPDAVDTSMKAHFEFIRQDCIYTPKSYMSQI